MEEVPLELGRCWAQLQQMEGGTVWSGERGELFKEYLVCTKHKLEAFTYIVSLTPPIIFRESYHYLRAYS